MIDLRRDFALCIRRIKTFQTSAIVGLVSRCCIPRPEIRQCEVVVSRCRPTARSKPTKAASPLASDSCENALAWFYNGANGVGVSHAAGYRQMGQRIILEQTVTVDTPAVRNVLNELWQRYASKAMMETIGPPTHGFGLTI